jgi:hypothetical protein
MGHEWSGRHGRFGPDDDGSARFAVDSAVGVAAALASARGLSAAHDPYDMTRSP